MRWLCAAGVSQSFWARLLGSSVLQPSGFDGGAPHPAGSSPAEKVKARFCGEKSVLAIWVRAQLGFLPVQSKVKAGVKKFLSCARTSTEKFDLLPSPF